MLELTLKTGQKIMIGDTIWIAVAGIGETLVKLAIEAPREVPIVREEAVKRDAPKDSDEQNR